MALSQKKRVILVKLETAYGVDPTLAATDGILCSNLEITPMAGSSVERDFIRSYFGASGSIRVENFVELSFETEIAGSGTAGTAPAWGSLLRASNFSATTFASAIIGTSTAGSATTLTLPTTLSTPVVAPSAVDGFYVGMTVTSTGGPGASQSAEIVAYNGTTRVATLATTLGTPFGVSTVFTITPNVIYRPNSDFGTASPSTSAFIAFYLDGIRHILKGARGTVSFDLSVKQIPKMKWKFTGLLSTITDTVIVPGDYAAWKTPVTVSTANTTDINLLGYNSGVISTLNFDIANSVIYRQMIGSESVLITDRKPTGNVSLEATLVAAKDWWTAASTAASGYFCVKHGQTAGNIVGFTAPKIQLSDPKYSDSDGVAMMDFTMAFIPSGTGGNDEIAICVK